MVLPKARRDLFILDPSLKRAPAQPVAAPLSEPARSIIDSLPILTSPLALACIFT